MKIVILSIIGLAFWEASCSRAADPPASVPPPTKSEYLHIANEVDANLQHEILDKCFPTMVDEQGGGFFENYGTDYYHQPRAMMNVSDRLRKLAASEK